LESAFHHHTVLALAYETTQQEAFRDKNQIMTIVFTVKHQTQKEQILNNLLFQKNI